MNNIFNFTSIKRVENALFAIRYGQGVLILDNKNKKNECNIIFATENLTLEQMALTIRYGSGIVCLCITEERRLKLNLPMMVKNNINDYNTAFTITIEAAKNITTGVSASDRLITINYAMNNNVKLTDLKTPGHIFPLCVQQEGILIYRGHTEATIDLSILAGLKPAGILCELINKDGTILNIQEIIKFSKKYNIPILTIKDIIKYKKII